MKNKFLVIALSAYILSISTTVSAQSTNHQALNTDPVYCLTVVRTRVEGKKQAPFVERLYKACSATQATMMTIKKDYFITTKIVKIEDFYYYQTSVQKHDGNTTTKLERISDSDFKMETNFGTVDYTSIRLSYSLQEPGKQDNELPRYLID